jgi:hypothetical protein
MKNILKLSRKATIASAVTLAIGFSTQFAHGATAPEK